MSEMKLSDRANEAAHEAVLALLHSGHFPKGGTESNVTSQVRLLASFHHQLADYYRSLKPEDD